jgi:hypothetical protein
MLKSKAVRSGIWGAALFAGALMAAPAHAGAIITFTYDCVVASATSCPTGGGPFGTITLTDSTVDTNRVDISIVLNGPKILALEPLFTGLDNFFLNYTGVIPSNTTFKMVLTTDPAGSFNSNGGDVNVNLNSQGPKSTTLDFRLDPAGSVPSLTFAASLGLFSTASGHAETNLDASMFNSKDANSLLFSAFNTLPSNHTFNGGALTVTASTTPTVTVPEPLTLSLFGAGLAGMAAVRRRKAKTS